jgi:glutathione S-transferase
MLRLYDYWESGNCYKVRLLLSQLGLSFERVHLDILKGETREPEFVAKHPNHRVPLLEWPDGRRLAESNAILWHLAESSPFIPQEAWPRAQILQWMFFEQYSHEPNIATVRFWHFAGRLEENHALIPGKVEAGYHALGVMETHLESHSYFVGERYTIADIALYAYTHVAAEGGFDLNRYRHTREWLGRVAAQPRHIKINEQVGTLVPWPQKQ